MLQRGRKKVQTISQRGRSRLLVEQSVIFDARNKRLVQRGGMPAFKEVDLPAEVVPTLTQHLAEYHMNFHEFPNADLMYSMLVVGADELGYAVTRMDEPGGEGATVWFSIIQHSSVVRFSAEQLIALVTKVWGLTIART